MITYFPLVMTEISFLCGLIVTNDHGAFSFLIHLSLRRVVCDLTYIVNYSYGIEHAKQTFFPFL